MSKLTLSISVKGPKPFIMRDHMMSLPEDANVAWTVAESVVTKARNSSDILSVAVYHDSHLVIDMPCYPSVEAINSQQTIILEAVYGYYPLD